VRLPVVSFEQVTPWTRLLVLDIGAADFRFDAGQAVFLGRAGQPVRKPYSIACAPLEARTRRRLEFLIALDPGAAPDAHLAELTPGATVELSDPAGRFVLPDPPPAAALFVAGGTGIAPLRAMLHQLIATAPDATAAVAYAARTAADFAFGDDLRRLVAAGRLTAVMVASRDPAGSGWDGPRGRLAAGHLRPLLGRGPEGPTCFVCGPPGFVAHAVSLLGALGVPPARIRREDW
jgi:ferredoxin-NADP reductase